VAAVEASAVPVTTTLAPPRALTVHEGPVVRDIDFADDRNGYAIRYTCTNTPISCTRDLLSTEDGEHWVLRSLPSGVRLGTGSGRLRVLGPRQLAIADLSVPGQERWYSADAGQTWQQVPGTPEDTVEAIPAGGLLDFVCHRGTSRWINCVKTSLVVTLPESGRLATLANQPGLELMHADRLSAAADGSWWVPGLLPATGRWAVAVSRDAGRTWSVVPLPGSQGPPLVGLRVTVAREAVYAVGVGRLPGSGDSEDGLISIFRSTDGGRTWQQTWRAVEGKEPRSIAGVAMAGASGRLIVHTTTGGAYVSGDGGASFAPAGIAGTADPVRWSRAGYLAYPTTPPSPRFRISRDGVTWTVITVG
jgi:BNR/Asp-box repeat